MEKYLFKVSVKYNFWLINLLIVIFGPQLLPTTTIIKLKHIRKQTHQCKIDKKFFVFVYTFLFFLGI